MSFKKNRIEFLLLMVIVIAFIFLQPKLSSVLLPQKRAILLNNFLSTTKEKNHLDARSFWLFREFYYPGYFSLNKTGFDTDRYQPFLNETSVDVYKDTNPLVFLTYKSDKINSIEVLVDNGILDEILTKVNNTHAEITYQDDTSLIEKNNKYMLIIFTKPTSEMVLANGYYDFKNPRDRAIIENRYWLSISKISLD